MMFDGAAVVTAAVAVDMPAGQEAVLEGVGIGRQGEYPVVSSADLSTYDLQGMDGNAPPLDEAGFPSADAADAGWSGDRHAGHGLSERAPGASIIFVDTAVENHAELARAWSSKGEVVLIDKLRDGIDQMMSALAGRSGLAAIHIVSHGADGSFTIGTTHVDIGAVEGELGPVWASVGAKLIAGGDILIYGCDVGVGDAGRSLVDTLAAKSGADVAASSDPTGAAELGGDWILEYRAGAIGADPIEAKDWKGLLAQMVINPTGGVLPDGTDGLSIAVTPLGQMQVRYQNQNQLYNPDVTDDGANLFNGMYIAVGSQVVGPSHGAHVMDSIEWTPLNQRISGRGTSGDPFVVTTNLYYNTGRSGYQAAVDTLATVKTSYVSGTKYFTNTITVTPPSSNTEPVKWYHTADTYLGGGDYGPAYALAPGVGATTSTASNPHVIGTRRDFGTPSEVFVGFAEIDGDRQFDRFYSGFYNLGPLYGDEGGAAGTGIAGGGDIVNTITAAEVDNGLGIQFNLGAIKSATTFGYRMVFDGDTAVDLDSDNSTAAGNNYIGFYGAGSNKPVPVVDADIVITNVVADISRATVAIDNAQVGDRLSVIGTLPEGIEISIADNLVTLAGSATETAYQSALRQIMFSSTNSLMVDRSLTVSVFNELSSLPATANVTINVGRAPVIDLNSGTRSSQIVADGSIPGSSAWITSGSGQPKAGGYLWDGDFTAGTLHQAGLTGWDVGESPSGAAQLKFDFRWQNGVPDNSSSAVLDITIGGVTYAKITSGNTSGIAGTASIDFFNGATGSPHTVTASAIGLTPVIIDLPSTVPPTGDLLFSYNAGGSAGFPGRDDMFVTNVSALTQIDVSAGQDFANAYTETGTPVAIADTDASITDGDSANMQSATIVLTNEQAGDRFRIGGVAGTILANGSTGTINGLTYTVTDTDSTITIQLTGSATKAVYADTIESVFFESTSDNPGTTSRVINVTVNDGTTNSNTAVTTISVAPVNDAPVNGMPAAGYTIAEDSGALALTGLSIADADANSGSMTVTLSIPAGSGTLNATGAGGVGVTGTGTNSIVLTGTLTNINAYLAGASRPTYTQVADFNGSVTLTMVTSDGGNSGSGGTLTDTDTRTITITAVADIAADTPSVNEDTVLLISPLANDSFENAGAQITAVAGVAIAPGGSVAVPNGSVTLNASNQLVFTPAANFNGTSTFSYTVTSGGVTETANITVTVNAVNDAPAGTDATLPATEDTPFAFTAANFGFSDAIDGDAFAGVVITTVPANGTMLLNGVAVTAGTFVTVAQLAAGQLTWQGAANANGSGLGSFTFQVRDNGGTANGGQDTDQSPNSIAFTVAAVNDAPLAANDSFTIAEDTPAAIDVRANDGDVDAGAVLTVAAVNDTAMVAGGPGVAVTGGTVTLNAAGNLVFTPAADYNGPTSFSYAVRDENGAIATATVNGTVTPVADPVTNIVPGAVTSAEDTAILFGAAHGQIVAVTDPDNGTLTVTLTGTRGLLSLSSVAGLTFAGGDGIADATMTFSGSAAAISAALEGLSFQPDADYNGPAQIAMTTTRAPGGATDSDVIALTITPATDIVADTVRATEDTPVNFNVLTGSGGASADSFEDAGRAVTAVTQPPAGQGAVTFAADGAIVFAPAPDFNGRTSFSYTVTSGGVTETAPVTVNVGAANDAPTLDLDGTAGGTGYTATYAENGPGVAIIAANGSVADIDSAALSGATVVIANGSAGDILSLAGELPLGITASYDAATFTLTFSGAATPAAYRAALDAVRYASTSDNPATVARTIDVTVSDGALSSAPARATIAIVPVNDAPAGTDAVLNAAEDTLYIFTAGNFGFSDAAEGDGFAGVVISTLPANGTLTLNGAPVTANSFVTAAQIAAGQLVWTPAADATGNGLGSFTFQVRDDGGTANGGIDTDASPNTISFTVGNVNDAPVSSDLAETIAEDGVLTGSLPGYTDADGDIATYRAGTTVPAHGTVTINPDGTYTYTPTADYNGSDLFSFIVDDGNGGTVEQYVTVTITPVNDAPVVTSPIPDRSQPDGASVSFDISGFFADVADGDALSFSVSGLPAGLTMGANGLITGTIDPAASQDGVGGVYTVTVTASDGNGGTVSDTFSFTVTNPAPVAVDDAVTTAEDTPVTLNVLDGSASGGTADSDSDGDPLTVTPATAGNGTVTIGAGGAITYTPNADFNGTDTIVYTISDGNGGTAQAVVNVTVTPVNDAPTMTPIPDRLRNDGDTVSFNTSTFFNDVDGNTLTYSATGLPSGLTIDPATGIVSGTIAAGASGPGGSTVYTITVTANDGNGGQSSITYRNTVVNIAPNASDDSATTNEDKAVDIPALANDSDPDGDTNFIVRVNNQPLTAGSPAVDTANGSVQLVDVGGVTMLRFTPDADYNGTESFTYTIDDGNSGINTAVVTIIVNPVNDTPNAAATIPDRVRADGESFGYDMGDFFSDPDGDALNYVVTGLPAGLVMNPATGIISGTIDRNASQGGPAGDGVYTVTVTAYDRPGATGLSQTRTFTLTTVNPGPTANNDAVAASEDTPVVVDVLGNDVDPDGDPLVVAGASAGNGAVVINGDGTLTYTPNPDFNGTDTIIYTIDDGNGGTSSATVTVTVAPVNDAPTASPIPDILTSDDAVIDFDIGGYFDDVDAGTDLDFSFTGTLPPGLSFDPETGRISGTLTKDASDNAPYIMTITADDGNGGTVSTTLTWNIQNLPPHAFADTLRLLDDAGPASGTNILDNDVDPDNDGKVVAAINGDPAGIGQPVTGSAGGTFIVNADGTYTFDPGAAFDDLQVGESRTTVITYLLDDTDGGSDTGFITVTVDGTNDAPVATTIPDFAGADSQSITANPIDVAGFFSDVEGDALTFSATGLPPGLGMDAAGRITGAIDADASGGGAYTVVVTADDGRTTTSQSFRFNVANPAPAAVNDNASTMEDIPVHIDVLGNDIDPDGDTLTIDPAFPPQAANGAVTVNPDGTLHYVPNADYNGVDTIVYRVTDGQGGFSTGVVHVSVGSINDTPTSTSIAHRAGNDADPVTLDVSGNFADVDGTLSFAATGLPPGLSIDPATGVISGTLDRSASVGGPHSVVVTATDDGGASTQQAFVWTVANPAPTAVDDVLTVGQDGQGSGDVTPGSAGQDSDPDGDPLTVSAVNGAATNVGAAVAGSADGRFTIAADGSYSFDPGGAFDDLGAGQTRTTSATYTISDGQGGTSTATVTVTVTGANDAPVAGTLPGRTASDGEAIRIDTATAFSDVDNGDALGFTATGLPPGLSIDPATGEILGTLTSDASRSGPYSIVVTATDSGGHAASASFTLPVVNLPPIAVDDSASTAEDTALAGSVATNDCDTEPDGDPLSYSMVSAPAHGALTLFPDGRYTYVSNADFNGTDGFTYRVDDGNGGTADAVVTLTVTPVNDAAVAANDNFVTVEDAPVTFDVRANDVDVDGPALTVTAIDGTAIAVNQGVAVTGGSVTLNPDGTLTFATNANYNGTPQFTYTVSDGVLSDTAIVQGVVTPVNDAPTASAPPATPPEDTPVSGQVVATDIDGDVLTFTVTTSPANGTVTVGTDGSYVYTPNANFNGSDSFTVTVSDGNGGTVLVTIPVTVTPVNDVPTASALPATTPEDTPVGGRVTASDVEGDALSYSVTTPPANGSVTLNPDGSYVYTPNANFNGGDSFSVTVSDGHGGTALVTVPVTVTPVNDAPTASASPMTTEEGEPIGGRVVGVDADGDTLTYTVTTPPAAGAVTMNPDGHYVFTPAPGFVGTDSFTITVSDGNGGRFSLLVPVAVRSGNTAPSDGDENVTAPQDTPVTVPVLANASDPDGDPLMVTTASASVGSVTVNPDGTITFLPPAGFVGAVTISHTVSDGRGGETVSQIIVTVVNAGVDVNALLDGGDPFGGEVEPLRPAEQGEYGAPLIVLDAVNGVRSLSGTPTFGSAPPLLTAVNDIDPLNGTRSLTDVSHPINAVVHYLDRFAPFRSDVDRLFENRFDATDIQRPEGFSVRTVGSADHQLVMESIVRGHVIYLELRDEGEADAPPIVEYQLRTRDGRPLPDWIRFDARGLAIIERPADADELRLIAVGIRADGSRIEVPVLIQGATGEIQLDAPVVRREIGAAAPLGAVMASASASSSSETALLLGAFDG